MTKRTINTDLLKLTVAHFLANLRTEDRITVVAWISGGTIHVDQQFPNWTKGFNGPTAVTTARRDSPLDNVVCRLLNGLED